jgi:hypothetical protein
MSPQTNDTAHFVKMTIFQCNEFLKLNVEERNGQARNLKLCLNCLRDNNFVNTCQSKFKCRKCNQSHNTLLYKERQITKTNETGGKFKRSFYEVPIINYFVINRDRSHRRS